ncbi:molybdate ABC transporter substrate-binding protein [Cribrihabitans neustonicus]|uniref:molybdate ABC transporter substrate-binding protein n=1 Tax=Cribrihabitans neustonicus TaxID=1429085 RepID=UPI003B5AEBB0
MRLLLFPARRGHISRVSTCQGVATLVLGLLLLCHPGLALAGQITVFAAASLKTALDAASAEFEAETGTEVTLSYGGSPMLARQITLGAPADVFISANPGWMDHLQGRGLIEAAAREDLLTNRLVLIAHGKDAPPVDLAQGPELESLLQGGRLAMALAEAVPAGIYGKAALEALGQWETAAAKTAQAANVRAALALVASGEAPYGIVYATDAAASDAVSIVYSFPPESHPPIRYPVAPVTGRNTGDVPNFLTYLRGPRARRIFEDHGFGVLPK